MKFTTLTIGLILLLQLQAQQTVDNSTAINTVPFKLAALEPGVCAYGQFYFKTNATAATVLYACTATNTWSQQGVVATCPPSGSTEINAREVNQHRSGALSR